MYYTNIQLWNHLIAANLPGFAGILPVLLGFSRFLNGFPDPAWLLQFIIKIPDVVV